MKQRFLIEKFGNLTMVNEKEKKEVTRPSYNEMIREAVAKLSSVRPQGCSKILIQNYLRKKYGNIIPRYFKMALKNAVRRNEIKIRYIDDGKKERFKISKEKALKTKLKTPRKIRVQPRKNDIIVISSQESLTFSPIIPSRILEIRKKIRRVNGGTPKSQRTSQKVK